jgi:hypothetical protein
MCYEERYYSEWAGRKAKMREEAQRAVKSEQRETKPEPAKPEPEKVVKERQLEEV